MFMAFLISLISSRLTVRWTKRNRFLFVDRKSPLMGVSVSLTNNVVTINSKVSQIVFKPNITAVQRTLTSHNNRESLLEPVVNRDDPDDDRYWYGRLGSSSGFDVLRIQARTRDMIDIPSPTEWWIFKTATFSASEVFKSSKWSSHNGLEMSNGIFMRSET